MPKRISRKSQELHGTLRGSRPVAKTDQCDLKASPDGVLDSVGQAEWSRVSRAAEEYGLIHQLDSATLAAYCNAYSRWRRAEERIRSDGEFVAVTKFDTHMKPVAVVLRKNPWLSVSETTTRIMARLAESLGLSSAARRKLGIEVELSDSYHASETLLGRFERGEFDGD